MIASLKGNIVLHHDSHALIECGHVGYWVEVAPKTLTSLVAKKNDVFVFVYTHVSEDSLKLFGFATFAEREIFNIVLSINGVGPKLAMAIVSQFEQSEFLDVVQSADIARLTEVPGVGRKKAERLLLDLNNKIDALRAHVLVSNMPSKQHRMRVADLASVLVNLGHPHTMADHIARKAIEDFPNAHEEELIKQVLLRIHQYGAA